MEKPSELNPEQDSAQAVAHIASAQEILKALQEKDRKASRNRCGHYQARDSAEYPDDKDWRVIVGPRVNNNSQAV
jgi:hypothetical protein